MIAILLLSLFSELHWRPIGPIRGGRTKAAAGVPQNNLILAWDFHVASDDSIERWLISMRDQTFAEKG